MYFVELDAMQEFKVRENSKIELIEFTINDRNGFLFNRTHTNEIADILNWANIKVVTINIDGIDSIVPSYDKPRVHILSGQKNTFYTSYENIRDIFNMDIFVRSPVHPTPPIMDSKGFNIYHWCSPKDTKTNSSGVYVYSGLGKPFLMNNEVYAELVNENHLYILSNLESMENGHVILAEILDKVIDYKKGRTKNTAESLVGKLLWMAQNAIIPNLYKKRQEQKKLEELAEQLQQKLTQTLIRLDKTRVEVDSIMKTKDNLTKRLTDEVQSLLESPDIDNVKIVSDNVIEVYTNLIYCIDPGTRYKYELGKFMITIYIDQGSVKFKNLTRQVRGYGDQYMHAPHVFENQKACFGNIDSMVPALISKGEYVAVIYLAINFLQTVNTSDDAGKYINNWPRIRKAA